MKTKIGITITILISINLGINSQNYVPKSGGTFTGNVGIGVTNPSKKLDVNGTIKSRKEIISQSINPGVLFNETDITDKNWHLQVNSGDFKFYEVNDSRSNWSNRIIIKSGSGNLGINTTNPSEKLDINGNLKITGDLKMSGPDSYIWTNGTGTGATGIWDQKNRRVLLYTSESTGNVGIGIKDTKGFKLGVDGKIAATEIKVATYNNWPDFVFNKNYNLPTLKEVEKQIILKGHLKDIPSAKKVKTNGFFLGEMNAKLLQKIEELTLYTIIQDKELKKQNARINSLEKNLEKLKLEVNKLLKNR